MDPMIDFVRQRTDDLQRTAETVRRDRDLRGTEVPSTPSTSTAPLTAVAVPVDPTDTLDDPCQGVACRPVDARHAA